MDSKLIDVLLIEDDVVDQMAFKRLVKTMELPYNYTIADSVASARKVPVLSAPLTYYCSASCKASKNGRSTKKGRK